MAVSRLSPHFVWGVWKRSDWRNRGIHSASVLWWDGTLPSASCSAQWWWFWLYQTNTWPVPSWPGVEHWQSTLKEPPSNQVGGSLRDWPGQDRQVFHTSFIFALKKARAPDQTWQNKPVSDAGIREPHLFSYLRNSVHRNKLSLWCKGELCYELEI